MKIVNWQKQDKNLKKNEQWARDKKGRGLSKNNLHYLNLTPKAQNFSELLEAVLWIISMDTAPQRPLIIPTLTLLCPERQQNRWKLGDQ